MREDDPSTSAAPPRRAEPQTAADAPDRDRTALWLRGLSSVGFLLAGVFSLGEFAHPDHWRDSVATPGFFFAGLLGVWAWWREYRG